MRSRLQVLPPPNCTHIHRTGLPARSSFGDYAFYLRAVGNRLGNKHGPFRLERYRVDLQRVREKEPGLGGWGEEGALVSPSGRRVC